jgi:hypothetical protein
MASYIFRAVAMLLFSLLENIVLSSVGIPTGYTPGLARNKKSAQHEAGMPTTRLGCSITNLMKIDDLVMKLFRNYSRT